MTPQHPPIALLRNAPTREIIKALEHEGFQFTERQGSQRVYRHPDRRRVVIHFHPTWFDEMNSDMILFREIPVPLSCA